MKYQNFSSKTSRIVFILIFSLFACSLFPNMAVAANACTFSVSSAEITNDPGQTATITVSTTAPDIETRLLRMVLVYDRNKLDCTQVVPHSQFSDAIINPDYQVPGNYGSPNAGKNALLVSYTKIPGIAPGQMSADAGNICTVTFSIKSGVAPGEIQLELDPVLTRLCCSSDAQAQISLSNGVIVVTQGSQPNTQTPASPTINTPTVNPVKPETPVVPDKLETNNAGLQDIKGHWAEEYITKMASLGITKGYPDGTFKPDNNISRAEFTTMLVKVLNCQPKSGKLFEDTANHWAKDSIATAEAYGIIGGISETIFAPDSPVTREQMASMIVKALGLKANGSSKSFSDADKISSWAKDAVNIVTGNAIMSGYQDNTFRAQNSATRAEAITVLSKVMEMASNSSHTL